MKNKVEKNQHDQGHTHEPTKYVRHDISPICKLTGALTAGLLSASAGFRMR
jgi:hypothetical protein